jgi:hypothetical protein
MHQWLPQPDRRCDVALSRSNFMGDFQVADLDVLCSALRPTLQGGARPPDDQWDGALRLAAGHDLLPALWSAGRERGWWTALPTDALAQVVAHFAPGSTHPPLVLQQAYDANRLRESDLSDQGSVILEYLASAGIVAVPLKGLHALMAGWWPDPADRVMRDLDILVSKDDAGPASQCLASLGYLPFATGHTAAADHELPAVALPGRAGSVELHTALVVSRWSAVLSGAEILDGGPLMSSTDAVIHSIAHAQLHDEAHLLARIPLRALHELMILAAGPRGDEIDWTRVRTSFRRVSAEAALDAHLRQARSLFGASVPPPVGRLRPSAHDRLCRTLVSRPPLASIYERTAFLPRGLSTERMHELHGPGSPWISRVRHAAHALHRMARSRRTDTGAV